MFSNEINTSDLFFSNPIDHFLGQDHEIKTSFESGFSSSFNQTGNSKEQQYRSSQDLFSLNDRSDSQYGRSNSDYQKYISQNLLMGKKDASFVEKGRDTSRGCRKEKVEKDLNSPQNEFSDNEIKEIRKSLDILKENTTKINLDIKHQNKSIHTLQEEMLKLNEKLSSIDTTIANKQITGNHKDAVEKEENDRKKLHEMISENAENISYLVTKIDDHIYNNDKKLLDSMKKNYETMNKKQMKNLENIFSQINRNIEGLNEFVDASVKNIQYSVEKVFEQKVQDLKSYTDNFVQKLAISSDIYVPKSSQGERNMPKQMCVFQNDTCVNTCFKKPIYSSDLNYRKDTGNYLSNAFKTSNCNLQVNTGKSNEMMQRISKTTSDNNLLIPFVQHNRNAENVQMHSIGSNVNSECTDKVPCTNLKIKRRVATPLAKFISPIQRKFAQKNNAFCTPLITFSKQNYQAHFQGNDPDIFQTRSTQYKYKYKEKAPSFTGTYDVSSPALSVYQVSKLAKEYTFY